MQEKGGGRASGLRLGLIPRLISLVVLAALVTGGLIGAVVIRSSRHTLREQISTGNLAAVGLAAEFTLHYVESAQISVRELASRASIVRAVIRDVPEQVEPELVQFLKMDKRFDSASIYDAKGIGRASGVIDWQNRGGSVADRDWFQQVMTTAQPHLGVPVISRGTGHPNVPYGVPILDKRGVVRGALVVGIPLEGLSQVVTGFLVGPAARASLLDFRQGGIMIAHPDRERILKPVPGKNEAARRLLAGERGTMETHSSTGEAVLAAFAPVPRLPWGILILAPHDIAFAPMDALTRRVLLLVGLVVACIGALGGWMATQITRPLIRLRNAANRLAAGDLTHRVHFTQFDEIRDLGRTFDHMAVALVEKEAQLRAHADELEHRVRERTAELVSANEALEQRTCQLEAVRVVSAEITSELSLATLLGLILRRALELVGTTTGTIFLWDEGDQALVPRAWHGPFPWLGELRLRPGEGVAGTAAERRRGMIVNDFRTSPFATPVFLKHSTYTAVLAEPLLYHGRLLALLSQ